MELILGVCLSLLAILVGAWLFLGKSSSKTATTPSTSSVSTEDEHAVAASTAPLSNPSAASSTASRSQDELRRRLRNQMNRRRDDRSSASAQTYNRQSDPSSAVDDRDYDDASSHLNVRNVDIPLHRAAESSSNDRDHRPNPNDGLEADDPSPSSIGIEDLKLGKKKLEKLRRKEVAKSQRESMLVAQEEREKERQKKEMEEELREMEAEERRKIEAEGKRKEQEQRDAEWASMFSVEGTGEQNSAEAELQKEQSIADFLECIVQARMVNLDELAAKFSLSTDDVLDRIRALEGDGRLLGVLDDRGKYLHVTVDEMKALSQFIRSRGKVSIQDIVKEVNRIIQIPDKVH
eukprot:ANDGO_00598.mRNA.1 DDRGK domain-containing protein 1